MFFPDKFTENLNIYSYISLIISPVQKSTAMQLYHILQKDAAVLQLSKNFK